MAATPSKRAVPSIFMIEPNGNTILLVGCDIPKSSCAVCNDNGNVAELDDVANAIAIGAERARNKVEYLIPVNTFASNGNTMPPCTKVSEKTNKANNANSPKILLPLCIVN